MWRQLETRLTAAISDNTIPGIGVVVRQQDAVLFNKIYGSAQLVPEVKHANQNTKWDLASLTKILFTTTLFLYLHDRNILNVTDRIKRYLPNGPEEIKIADLLSHSSGLPAWHAFYEDYLDQQDIWSKCVFKDAVFDRASAFKIQSSVGEKHCYSDIGFILLGAIIEVCTGKSLDKAWALLPCVLTKGLTWGCNPHLAAATEDCQTRKRIICGTVHDLNSDSMGGCAPHAGLFGTLINASRALHWPLDVLNNRDSFISRKTLSTFWNTRGAGSHVLGWDTPSGPKSSASEKWPKNGVGHLAFTGCSSWLAPDWDLSVTLVSNRIHPIASGGVLGGATAPKYLAFKQLRRDVHRLIVEIYGKLS